MNVPVTFDDPTVNYGLVGFGGAENATVVIDPTLATNKVGRVVKTNTAELWAGASITALAGTVQTSFANAIPFTATERRMNVRVWSPHAGIQVRLKVEDKNDPTRSVETEATVTVASGWQTLEFNFNNQAAGTAAFNPAFTYNKASLFFNFGVTGATAGERIYFFDDVKLGAAPVIAPAAPTVVSPVNFCQNAGATLTATASAGNTLVWYTVATGGVGTTTAPFITNAVIGTTTFYVSQRNAALVEGPRAAINVVVRATPLAPITVTPVAYCVNAQSALLSATAEAGNSLLWYSAATGGTGSVNIPTTITTVSGSTTYYVSQTNAGACESPRAAIVVNIVATPVVAAISAAPYTKLFPGLNTTISAATPAAGTSYLWYKNGVELIGQTGNSISIKIDGAGNYTLKATNLNGCVGSSNTITIADSVRQQVFIYPNPSTGRFQIRYYSDINNLKPRKVAIYNAAGALIYNATFVIFGSYTPMNIDLTRHGSGIYFIHLLDSDGKNLATEKILIR